MSRGEWTCTPGVSGITHKTYRCPFCSFRPDVHFSCCNRVSRESVVTATLTRRVDVRLLHRYLLRMRLEETSFWLFYNSCVNLYTKEVFEGFFLFFFFCVKRRNFGSELIGHRPLFHYVSVSGNNMVKNPVSQNFSIKSLCQGTSQTQNVNRTEWKILLKKSVLLFSFSEADSPHPNPPIRGRVDVLWVV